MTSDSIGADISKDHLDVHRLGSGAAARFPNSSAGFRALTAWLSREGVERAVYEPTGPYHAAFERAFAGRLPLVKVNPLQARRFAQARHASQDRPCRCPGSRGDGRCVAVATPGAGLGHPARPQGVADRPGQALVKDRTRLLNRLRSLELPLLRRQNRHG